MASETSRSILIAGGGIGGLTLAGFLQQRGIAFELAERAPGWAPVGAGIALAFNPMKLLHDLGVGDAVANAGFAFTRGVISDHRAKTISDADLSDVASRRGPTIALHRAKLHDALLTAVDTNAITLGRGVMRVALNDKVEVTFSDDSSKTYDIVVGADGIGSAVRTSVFDDFVRRYSGYTCWRLVVDVDSGVNEPWEMWGPGRRFGVVPIAPGRTYCFSTLNAPPDSDAMRNIGLAKYREAFRDFGGAVPKILAALERDDELIHGDLEEVRAASWVKGGVVLLGDAAHAMTPNMGQGAAMAIEDAYVLAEELAKDQSTESALANYEARRRPRVEIIQRQSWNFGRLSQWENGVARGLRNVLLRLIPGRAAAKRLEDLLATPI
jgi:2-heptyl-3-hydroxy-4(1H)-quinolone synthase